MGADMKRMKWTLHQKGEFLERIGQFLQRGYSLSTSIEFYGLNEKTHIRQHLEQMLAMLKEGEPLYEILERFGFPSDVSANVFFSEYHDLSEGLIQSGQMLQKREELKKRLESILRYPLFLIWLTIVMLFIIVHYVFPRFSTLYTSIDSELPAITNIMIAFVNLFPMLVVVFTMTAFFIFLFILSKVRSHSPQKMIDVLLKIPFVHTITKLIITQRFSTNLSVLLKAGMSINEAMQIFEKQRHSLFFQQEAAELKHRLQSGESLEAVITGRRVYREELASVINHGHMNGQLADELSVYADILSQKLDEKIKKALTIIQPLILSAVGLLVLLMFLSIMLPMLDVIQSL
mgnify:CR=1 FL=1